MIVVINVVPCVTQSRWMETLEEPIRAAVQFPPDDAVCHVAASDKNGGLRVLKREN